MYQINIKSKGNFVLPSSHSPFKIQCVSVADISVVDGVQVERVGVQ